MRSTVNGVALWIAARALDHDRAIYSPYLNPGAYKIGSLRIDHVSTLCLDDTVEIRSECKLRGIPPMEVSSMAHILRLPRYRTEVACCPSQRYFLLRACVLKT